MAAQMTRGIPLGFFELPLIRSYSKLGNDGNLYRVEVRGIAGNHPVQATFPMPSKAQPRYKPPAYRHTRFA